MGRHKKRGPKRKPKRDYQREYMMSKFSGNSVGAPDPHANATTHGVVAFKNQVKRRTRRGRSLIASDLISRRESGVRNGFTLWGSEEQHREDHPWQNFFD
jgi:hypothetical protein